MRKAALLLVLLSLEVKADSNQDLYLIHQLSLALFQATSSGDRSYQSYFDFLRTNRNCLARSGELCSQLQTPQTTPVAARRMQLALMEASRVADRLPAGKKPPPHVRFDLAAAQADAAWLHSRDRLALRELWLGKKREILSLATLHYLHLRSLCEIYGYRDRLTFLNEFARTPEGKRILTDLPPALLP
ncbi:MAG: hypothetical protein HS115_07340 [Spirochaetales bacterium]|nr:hypothetical protein [Spirochaetales bacterium]